jgi:hypothetical protein
VSPSGPFLKAFAATVFLVVILFLTALVGCSERDLSKLRPAPGNTDPVVFDDNFGSGVDYQAFSGSFFDAVAVDTDQAYVGDASLRITVPGPGSTEGTYAGGAFTSNDFRDLSSYDALVFYAKTSVGSGSTLDVAGLGNDNTGTSLYTAQRGAIPITTDWSLVVIPIPNRSRLDLERGLFFFAEGHESNQGFTLWFDEVRFVQLGTISNPRPTMATKEIETFVGATVNPEETEVTFDVNGEDVLVVHSSGYFDYTSSDEAVVSTSEGVITAVGGGTATVTAKLDTVAVEGEITLNVLAPPDIPAPTPAYPSEDVISLFSDVYTNVPVDTWRAEWSQSGPVLDQSIGQDAVKVYTELERSFAGIEFTTALIDASEMTHVRVDVWAPAGSDFRVKLVDFGEDGEYNLPIDESELRFTANTTPAFVAGEWSVLDIPLSNFSLDSRAHLAQIVISSTNAKTVFLDNLLFHR